MIRPIILTVPGLLGSGDDHWQTLWERERDDTHRIDLGDWEEPNRTVWMSRIGQQHFVHAARGGIVRVTGLDIVVEQPPDLRQAGGERTDDALGRDPFFFAVNSGGPSRSGNKAAPSSRRSTASAPRAGNAIARSAWRAWRSRQSPRADFNPSITLARSR